MLVPLIQLFFLFYRYQKREYLVVINNQGVKIETGLKKVGAFLGDNVEVGCGSVLNPGTVVGRESNIYPLSSVRGVVPEKSIYKCKTEVVNKLDDEI